MDNDKFFNLALKISVILGILCGGIFFLSLAVGMAKLLIFS